eukprot:TRINITY_DN8896_c0_g1_i1.p1 TRINITY_DN8896_c0_g1~~TRINITY_DN8896_c0_g1_i1.p1  ORF type:complete len:171 (-),score=33.91 TRINITY_DN8896_c0_g1_i1:343-855(-)
MQAIIYTCLGQPGQKEVAFWWIKPREGSEDCELEEETLNLHNSGTFKNLAEGSKKVYAPLAHLFNDPTNCMCIIQDVSGAPRACIQQQGSPTMYLSFIWQEKWTTNPFSSNKFLMGRMVYQKDPCSAEFFSCGYHMSGELKLSRNEQRIQDGIMLTRSLKDLSDCKDLPT